MYLVCIMNYIESMLLVLDDSILFEGESKREPYVLSRGWMEQLLSLGDSWSIVEKAERPREKSGKENIWIVIL
jgi:hypothetical protein